MAKRVSFCAIAAALSLVSLFGSSVVMTGRISLLALSSFFCALVCYEFGPRYGFIHYLCVSLLALLLVQKRLFVFVYILFLGYYPIVKLYIEKLNKHISEWIIKIVYFSLALVLFYVVYKLFLIPATGSALSGIILKYLWATVLAAEVVFVLYDLVLSYIITYYIKYLRRHRNEV